MAAVESLSSVITPTAQKKQRLVDDQTPNYFICSRDNQLVAKSRHVDDMTIEIS
jgi:hypothetical protein